MAEPTTSEQTEWDRGAEKANERRGRVAWQLYQLLDESKVGGGRIEAILRVRQVSTAYQRSEQSRDVEDREALRAAVMDTALAFALWAAELDGARSPS